ncbi:DUF5329 domain-containing protein [Cognatilysobacter bugurensis]|uniref:DUF5329 domain-containing protein n=1 Tax=Cognatilysobacter bugurensis TaxID=543356 RepID=A0A918T072_9GAMM|nr:DUF5329 domain-containing protein [Lysobacter bugurensis]GHA80835.1 hypothetical protein GCM10007067_18550 [Lysobacter bugurensis]
MRIALTALLIALFGLADASAQERSAADTQREIGQLFETLRSSGCQFQRNGRWHDAAEAVTHLDRKRDYLVRKDLITNAESLIERAASESSLSGRPYLVKCPGAETVESRTWFMRHLSEIRRGAAR